LKTYTGIQKLIPLVLDTNGEFANIHVGDSGKLWRKGNVGVGTSDVENNF